MREVDLAINAHTVTTTLTARLQRLHLDTAFMCWNGPQECADPAQRKRQ
jgi:hypothetical protein